MIKKDISLFFSFVFSIKNQSQYQYQNQSSNKWINETQKQSQYQSQINQWRTEPVTIAETSKSCSPSIRISGSTIGTNPFCWQIEAYLANT